MSKSFANDFLKSFEELSLPQEILTRFDILECLAKNDYGDTYLLSEKESGSKFALKCYQKSDSAFVGHEAEILSGLSHKGLPRFEAEYENDDVLFILREYIEGMPLDEYLYENKIDDAQAVNIAIELCEILTYLHSQSAPIIHRDIKPSNIIINPNDNDIKLIDFGISRQYSEDAANDTTCFGTQKFAPPEQYGFSQTDSRADIYALGVVLRYMLTDTTDLKSNVQDKTLRHIIEKCSAFSPSARYRSASAVKNALENYRKRTRRKIYITVASIFVLFLVFTAGFAVGRYTDILLVPPADPNESVVVFVEPLIEDAVRLSLGKLNGEPILRKDLDNVTELFIIGENALASQEDYNEQRVSLQFDSIRFGKLENLEDLRNLEYLERLYIFAQQNLTDISPLISCARLRDVEIMHCEIADFSPLVNLTQLDNLELYDNPISDFSIFANVKSLTGLGVGGSSLRSISDLGDIRYIERLNLYNTKVANLDGIEKCLFLQTLFIADTPVRDFSTLDELSYLETLFISQDMEKYLNTLSREDVNVIFNN